MVAIASTAEGASDTFASNNDAVAAANNAAGSGHVLSEQQLKWFIDPNNPDAAANLETQPQSFKDQVAAYLAASGGQI